MQGICDDPGLPAPLAPNLEDLAFWHPVFHQEDADGVGAICGEADVVVASPVHGVCVCVAVDFHLPLAEGQDRGELGKHLFRFWANDGTAELEEGFSAALVFDELDGEAFRVHFDFEIPFGLEVLEGFVLRDCLGDAASKVLNLFGVVQASSVAACDSARSRKGAFLGEDVHWVAREVLIETEWVSEIGGDVFLLLFRHSEDPHHHKESHHRSDEVGIGYFPGSPVVSMAVALFLFDDDGGAVLHEVSLPRRHPFLSRLFRVPQILGESTARFGVWQIPRR